MISHLILVESEVEVFFKKNRKHYQRRAINGGDVDRQTKTTVRGKIRGI